MKAPKVKESPEAASARRRAEADAEKNLIGETRRGVTAETAAILRRFGIKAALAGSPGAVAAVTGSGGPGGGFSGGFGGNGGGSYNPGTFGGFASGGFGGGRGAREAA